MGNIITALSGGIGIFVFIVYLSITAIFTAWVGGKKGYKPVSWFFLGTLFGPLALIAIGVVPQNEDKFTPTRAVGADLVKRQESVTTKISGNIWRCPECNQKNDQASSTCKSCGHYR